MKEVRIGLVLYGGVSLAVYMNGIVTELWNILRASQIRARNPDPASRSDTPGTAGLYLKLLDELGRIEGCDEIRIVVDAVAGTSAGGVNGVVLAKSVVEGADASVLNDVWLEEADISNLMAKPQRRMPWYYRAPINAAAIALSGLGKARAKLTELPGISWEWALDHGYSFIRAGKEATSPLDGNFFAAMIAKTFVRMDASPNRTAPLLPDRGTFDLFVTRTDLHGWPRHLPLDTLFHPHPLYERTHAHVMHFQQRMTSPGFNDDFSLTYATRSTAGFPIAFAPINHADISDQYTQADIPGQTTPIETFTSRHLREHELMNFPADNAWMVDGGVLDNKPFTRVAEAIEHKPADHEVFRSVIYIEPDPETEVDLPPKQRPGPLAVASGMFPLFRHEPIYEDLRRLQQRNARIERIREIVRANSVDARRIARAAGSTAGLAWPPKANDVAQWRETTHALAAAGHAAGYPGYTALKSRRAAEELATFVCRALNYPRESRHAYLVRRIVRAWLASRGALSAPAYDDDRGIYFVGEHQLRLLDGFDTSFRLRRVRALVAAANDLYGEREPRDDSIESVSRSSDETRAMLDNFKRDVSDIAMGFEALLTPSPDTTHEIADAFQGVLDGRAIDHAIAQLDDGEEAIAQRYNQQIEQLYWTLQGRLAEASHVLNDRLASAIQQLRGDAHGNVMEAFVVFPLVDIAVYPIMDSAQLTDLVPVSVMRISPYDCVSLSRDSKRLKSRDLGAFAGFLEQSARAHDLMWGRLDGAERLIDLIMRASRSRGVKENANTETLKAQYTRLVQAMIMDEERARKSTTVAAE